MEDHKVHQNTMRDRKLIEQSLFALDVWAACRMAKKWDAEIPTMEKIFGASETRPVIWFRKVASPSVKSMAHKSFEYEFAISVGSPGKEWKLLPEDFKMMRDNSAIGSTAHLIGIAAHQVLKYELSPRQRGQILECLPRSGTYSPGVNEAQFPRVVWSACRLLKNRGLRL